MDLLKDVVDVFLDAPSTLSRLKEALQNHDAAGVTSAAHALKGSVGLFSQGRHTSARVGWSNWDEAVISRRRVRPQRTCGECLETDDRTPRLESDYL